MPSRTAVELAGAALLTALVLSPARAHDDWDIATPSDDGTFTDNVVLHGVEQVHDMDADSGVEDQDWYRTTSQPFSSYEMVVDGMTMFLRFDGTDVQRLDVAETVLEHGKVMDEGRVIALRWRQGTGSAANFVRVRSPHCSTFCDPIDTYRIRFYDTTYTLPRFNNSGTQSTVLLLQNATERTCTLTHHYFAASGALLASSETVFMEPRGLLVFATAELVPGQSGSVRVAHNCGYGGLSGKAVALEPATGFTFDTPLVPRPS